MAVVRFLLFLVFMPLLASAQIITTIAGTGRVEFSGNGGPATLAGMKQPSGIATGDDGSIYVIDAGYNIVRKIAPDGTISAYIGNYQEERIHPAKGYEGDGGPASNAVLWKPLAIVVDSGNIYLGDYENSVIRKVNANGRIKTIAGFPKRPDNDNNGTSVAVPDKQSVRAYARVYFADEHNNSVHRVSADGSAATVAGTGIPGYSGDGGLAINARLNKPRGAVPDQYGNLFIADTYNNVVRKVDASGVISTYAGNGQPGNSGDGGPATQAQLNAPHGIAIDRHRNLYITDVNSNTVRVVNAEGIISVYAGNGQRGYSGDNGPAAEAKLNYPSDVAVDTAGNVYIADAMNHVVRKVTAPVPIKYEAPVKDAFTVVADAEKNQLVITVDSAAYTSFTITNTSGKALMQQPLDAVTTYVPINILPPGRYFINLKKEGKVKTAMFVKDK